jgi:hypothetical protein
MAYHIEEGAPKLDEYYRHYKGGVYNIVGVAMDEETGETRVIYKNWSGQMFDRLLTSFNKSVYADDGKHLFLSLRFRLIDNLEALQDQQIFEHSHGLERD